jgi:hypothetical protein
MLSLLARLRALHDPRQIWGLTSNDHLCLLARNDPTSPRFVTIAATNTRHYFIEYLMPQRLAPWPNAIVCGEAHTEDTALQMILTAMEKSEGWSTNH